MAQASALKAKAGGRYAELADLMTPWRALKLAEPDERRAVELFRHLADRTDLPPAVAEMAVEERERVRLIQPSADKMGPPELDWDEDFEPPNAVD